MIRLLLVDDQESVLQALRMRLALENDIDIIGEAHDGSEALEQALTLKPDAIVMDVQMPGMDGITAAQLLTERNAHIPIIVLSIFDDDSTKVRAMQAGAVAFVVKRGNLEKLLSAVRTSVQYKRE